MSRSGCGDQAVIYGRAMMEHAPVFLIGFVRIDLIQRGAFRQDAEADHLAKVLVIDLEAIRQGQPPLRAHKRFDLSMFEQLEKGEELEIEETVYQDETITRYRMAILILSVVAGLSLLGVILLVFNSLT